jgi:DNA-binding SARP family transcriptional activator
LRYHPLVRDFLEDRLEREAGRPSISDLHRTVAEASEAGDWRTACYHYSVIGDTAAIGRTIDGAVEEIIARGDTIVALSFLSLTDESDDSFASHGVLRSRAEFRRGERAVALQRARAIAEAEPASAVALGNLASIAFSVGDAELAWATAQTLAGHSNPESAALMGDGMLALLGSSVDADLRQTTDLLSRLRAAQHARGHVHHEAISLLNLASHQKTRGEAEASLQNAALAASLLAGDQSSGELSAAQATKAWAHAHLGELHTARDIYRLALSNVETSGRAETLIEAAEVEVWYGSAGRADDLMAEIARYGTTPLLDQYAEVVGAQLALRERRLEEAASRIGRFRVGEFGAVVGLKTQQLTTRAHWSLVSGRPNAKSQLRGAIEHAEAQGATFWLETDRLLLGAAEGPQELKREIRRLGSDSGAYLSVVAEHIVQRLAELGADEIQFVRKEIESRRERWLPALRRILDVETESSARAAGLINEFGFAEDVPLLRRLSKRRSGDPGLGRDLARRVADPVFVEDQGRVAISVGSRRIEGTAVRRKVLTLLCFLLTRARFSSTRDEVLDSLWPNFEPAVALNSLNQTLYFLRRVFEPAYREDTSPGYVRHESDVVWLDRQLIRSRSQVCGDFIRSLGARPSPDEVEQLTSLYQGRFALDFAYEEWAVAHRDALHAAYLQVVENAVAADMATGHWERGIVTARRALSVDPEAEQIEASLVRLLRLSGAHAAAAEQYEHYSSVLKEGLGIEPPPLDAL